MIHSTAAGAASARDLHAELVELIGHDPGLDASRCEADRQLEFEQPQDAAADLVERSIA